MSATQIASHRTLTADARRMEFAIRFVDGLMKIASVCKMAFACPAVHATQSISIVLDLDDIPNYYSRAALSVMQIPKKIKANPKNFSLRFQTLLAHLKHKFLG